MFSPKNLANFVKRLPLRLVKSLSWVRSLSCTSSWQNCARTWASAQIGEIFIDLPILQHHHDRSRHIIYVYVRHLQMWSTKQWFCSNMFRSFFIVLFLWPPSWNTRLRCFSLGEEHLGCKKKLNAKKVPTSVPNHSPFLGPPSLYAWMMCISQRSTTTAATETHSPIHIVCVTVPQDILFLSFSLSYHHIDIYILYMFVLSIVVTIKIYQGYHHYYILAMFRPDSPLEHIPSIELSAKKTSQKGISRIKVSIVHTWNLII